MSTQRKTRAWQQTLSLEDLLDVERTTEGGRLIHFSLNYRAWTRHGWKEVIRYDTHHGRLHIHRFWREKKDQVEHLEEKRKQDYTEDFHQAEQKIQTEWRRYRRLIEKKIQKGRI
jgi:hypothetical protein